LPKLENNLSDADAGKQKILVADGDFYYRSILKNFLSSRGYEVECARDCEETVESLMRTTFGLCFIDDHLLAEQMQELIAGRRSGACGIPFVIITADISAETERRTKALSPIGYFVKSFNLADIGAAVDRILNK